jgi:hypothetical protein
MPLSKHIEAVRDMNNILHQSNNDAERAAVYIRVCHNEELVSDLLSEAAAHGCILAVKGGATVIMPELVPGWTKIAGGWRILQ